MTPRTVAGTAILVLLGLVPADHTAAALEAEATESCIEGTPAYGVCGSLGTDLESCRSELWGVLRPADPDQLPNARDTTFYTGNEVTNAETPLWQSVDVEGPTLFAAYYNGFQVWDVSGTNATDPEQLVVIDGRRDDVPSWPQTSEVDDIVQDIDAPDGNDGLVAMSGQAPVGVTLWNTADNRRSAPQLMYQDRDGKSIREIYAATIGSRAYAFAAAFNGDLGVHAYDITSALESRYDSCHEDTAERIVCPGVYLGPMVADTSISYLDGAALKGTGRHFLAVASGLPDGFGVQIWEVTDPRDPSFVVSGLGDQRNQGVALWEDGGRSYLASRRGLDVDLFDVTGCLQDGCQSFPERIGTFRTAEFPSQRFLTFSRSEDGTPYLYVGNNIKCGGGLQREYLLDVSDPRNPQDISPQGTYDVGGVEVDYWGWYYSLNPSGFSQVMPRRGKFSGDVFYRAALTILDVHQLVDLTPPPPCPGMTIVGPWLVDTTIEGDWISATGVVEEGATLYLRARDRIILEDGFSVDGGLRAEITPDACQ